MKVLITGATGILGKHLLDIIPNSFGTWYTNSYHSKPLYHMNICDKLQVGYVIDLIKPNVIIHCAGIGNVDFAETNYTETSNIIVEGTKNLHRIAKDYNALFVYISSNAVYDGNNPPYNEQSKRQPINRYGSIKRQAEDIVTAGKNWLIIRPFMLYGYPYPMGRQNWYTLIYEKLINRQQLKLVNDVYWQPTQVGDAARVIWQLIQQSEPDEIYNIAPDEKPVTLYEFGRMVANNRGLETRYLEAVDSNFFVTIAQRPINTQYDVSKIKLMGIEMMTIEEGLKDLL